MQDYIKNRFLSALDKIKDLKNYADSVDQDAKILFTALRCLKAMGECFVTNDNYDRTFPRDLKENALLNSVEKRSMILTLHHQAAYSLELKWSVVI